MKSLYQVVVGSVVVYVAVVPIHSHINSADVAINVFNLELCWFCTELCNRKRFIHVIHFDDLYLSTAQQICLTSAGIWTRYLQASVPLVSCSTACLRRGFGYFQTSPWRQLQQRSLFPLTVEQTGCFSNQNNNRVLRLSSTLVPPFSRLCFITINWTF